MNHFLTIPFEALKNFTSGISRSALLILIVLCCFQSLKAQVPVPEFTGTPVTGCAPLVVNFRDQTTGNPVFWNWDFGNGSLSNIQHPTAVYLTPGRYTVTLVVRNANGTNAITKTDYIVVNPSPMADFSANSVTGCAPVDIQFTDNSIDLGGNIVSWEWNFSDGTSSTQQNPLHRFDSVGFYTIHLRVTSSTGCQGTLSRSRYVRVVAGVTADFTFTEPGTCRPPFLVSFTDETSGPGNLTYLWDFGNATTSSQPNPIANYASPGVYTVNFLVQSDFGCSDTVQKNITINGTTTAINSPDSVCLNTAVNFQNASNPAPLSTIWDFGDGTQSTKLNDTISYSAPGTYTVKLINNYGNCTDSATRNIYVRPRPPVDFTANNLISCRAPLTVNFQDISPDAVSWQWNFGDGGTSTNQNPSHQYNAEGQYDVTLRITDNRGCINTITKPAFIRIQKPIVNLLVVPTGGCVPFNFTPTAAINSLDGVASYFWDFGDGFTTTVPNPSHIYGAVGVYTVKLRITTTGGCVDSIVVAGAVKVGTPPVTNFSANPTSVCAFTNVSFTDMSAPAEAWQWNFGDGTFSTEQNPVHAFTDTGTFTVSLIAYNNGCGQSLTRIQYIRVLPPIALFTHNITCSNKLQANFFNISKSDPSLPTTYLWEFGDPANSTSNAVNPVFTYPAVGTYLVRLTVTNGSCSNSYPLSVNIVGDLADFSVSKTAACVNEPLTVTAINSNPANIGAYEWSINGGPFVVGNRDLPLSFSVPGAYSISLRITDINNCSDTKTINPAVNVTGPVANFSLNSNGGCNNTTIVFNDLSNSANAIVEWFWDFGDGSTQTFTSAPFTHQYQNAGTYLVSLRVRDNQGCMDTFSLATPILITDPNPGFRADYPLICPNTPITFSDSSSGAGLTYNWDFGDGNSSTLKDPVHQYTGNDAIYTVKLVITDSIGCSDSVVKSNYVTVRRPKPAFDAFDTTSICPPTESRFVFRGEDYQSFLWDFGDGDISNLPNPKHFYNTYGSFTVKLFLTGFGGCLDSAMSTVNIYNPYTTTTMDYNPITACNDLLVDFNITTPPHTRFTFNAGDGFVDTSQAKVFQHLYQSLGFYAPFVVLADSLDCEVVVGGPNTVRILGALPFFGMDKKAFCDTGRVLFANFTIGNDPVITSVWDFGDGITSTLKDPSHTYTGPGMYLPSLTVTTEAGCVKTLSDTVNIYATPDPTILKDSVVCINELMPLQGVLAYPDTAVRWAWNFGNGASSTLQNPSTRYGNSGSYNIQLTATNLLGCTNNTSATVRVVPNPVINVLYNPVIPVGTGINLPVTYGPGIASYNWLPPANLDCPNCATPFANPKKTTKYTINVTDVNDCPASADIEVVVVCNEKNYFLPNTFSPNNDGNNDVFYPRGSGLTRIHSLRIFNRWGELVFERKDFPANDPSMGWDGTHRGKKANPDVYVYTVEWVCENSTIIPSRGNVALIR